jgi:hypothetical protein
MPAVKFPKRRADRTEVARQHSFAFQDKWDFMLHANVAKRTPHLNIADRGIDRDVV